LVNQINQLCNRNIVCDAEPVMPQSNVPLHPSFAELLEDALVLIAREFPRHLQCLDRQRKQTQLRSRPRKSFLDSPNFPLVVATKNLCYASVTTEVQQYYQKAAKLQSNIVCDMLNNEKENMKST